MSHTWGAAAAKEHPVRGREGGAPLAHSGVMQRNGIAGAMALVMAAGCYSTTEIPPAQLASMEHPRGAPSVLGHGVRLGPRTEVRAFLTDGSVTTWYPAGDLAVADDGLVTGRRVALSAATEVDLSGAGDGADAMLAATAPPGAEITPRGDRLRLRVRDARLMLPWIAAYAVGAATLRRPVGMLAFRGNRSAWETDPVPGSRFATVTPGALSEFQIAEGIPWRDVTRLELHNLDTLSTTGAILGAPIAMSLMLLATVGTAAAIADGDDPTPSVALGVEVAAGVQEAAASADAEADSSASEAWVRAANRRPCVLVEGGPEAARGATPLFTARARRRDIVKLVLSGEAGTTSDSTFTGGAGVGLRFHDFVELTARTRALAFDEAPTLGSGGGPESPPQHLLFGGRLALHIDTDGDPLTAFVVGAEILGGRLGTGADLTDVGFVLGPRFGLGDKMFASLLLAPSLLLARGNPGGPDLAVGQVMFSVELGFGL